MELYSVKDNVQNGIDFMNTVNDREVFAISEITKETIACPINQSLPEKIFKEIDCEVATTTAEYNSIGLSVGDLCITYKGNNIEEIKKAVLGYIINKNDYIFKTYHSLTSVKNFNIEFNVIHANIDGGYQFTIYNGAEFKCNIPELNKAYNSRIGNSNVTAQEIAEYISETFNTEIIKKLPADRKHVKNRRGIFKSCMSLGKVFSVEKCVRRIRTPLVTKGKNSFPKTSELGFGVLNNTIIKDGFYEGDLTYCYQLGEKEEAERFMEEKGDVIWLG